MRTERGAGTWPCWGAPLGPVLREGLGGGFGTPGFFSVGSPPGAPRRDVPAAVSPIPASPGAPRRRKEGRGWEEGEEEAGRVGCCPG